MRKEEHPNVIFYFLGHTFRLCKSMEKHGRVAFTGYFPVSSRKVVKKDEL